MARFNLFNTKRSSALMRTNVKFRYFLMNSSWIVYGIGFMLLMVCMYYFYKDCRRQKELKRRRQEAQRATIRQPQRRRPGAAHREHEIFRNVVQTVRRYIKQLDEDDEKPHVLQRTRSGAIYVRSADLNTEQ